jgi:hypothetical protein
LYESGRPALWPRHTGKPIWQETDVHVSGMRIQLYADLVGARTLALRTLLARQDWASTGVLSERTDVLDDEAKAVRRRRYAELRWSLDTSPQL